MNEHTLLRISLVCSVVGLFTLFLISSFSSIESLDIGKIDGTEPYALKVYGTIESIRSVGVGQVITVSQPSTIEVFVGSSTTVQRGDVVEVIGRAGQYEGDAQIVAERIRVVRGYGDDS